MILWPTVKEFIETNIKDIEIGDSYAILEKASVSLNEVAFNQLYNIISDLDLPSEDDIDTSIGELLREMCDKIIKENRSKYICIEDQWEDRYTNYLGNKERVIFYYFYDFDPKVKNGKHWCYIYD